MQAPPRRAELRGKHDPEYWVQDATNPAGQWSDGTGTAVDLEPTAAAAVTSFCLSLRNSRQHEVRKERAGLWTLQKNTHRCSRFFAHLLRRCGGVRFSRVEVG